MKIIKQLTRILTKSKFKGLKPLTRKGNLWLLYEGIEGGNFDNREDVLKHFGWSKDYYRKLSIELQERLIHSLPFINSDDLTEVQKAWLDCNSYHKAVEILKSRGGRVAALHLAEKTITKAITHEFTEIALSLARFIRKQYAETEGNFSKFKYYETLIPQLHRIFEAELLVETYYNRIRIHFAKSRATSIDVLEQIDECLPLLEPYAFKVKSFRFHLHYFNIIITGHQLNNNCLKLLESCDQAITFFQSQKGASVVIIKFGFRFLKIPAFLQLKEFNAAQSLIKECLTLDSEGSYNWHITQHYQIITAFHKGAYQHAWQTLQIIKNHPQQPGENLQDQARVLEAFVHFFVELGEINTGKEKSKFRLAKFLNEVPVASKDKLGLNISILIIQLMFLLKRKKHDQIIDRNRTLNQYLNNHLRIKDETTGKKVDRWGMERIATFIRMLLLLPKSEFRRGRAEYYTKKHLNKLEEFPLNISLLELEIVPYKVLWEEHVLKLL